MLFKSPVHSSIMGGTFFSSNGVAIKLSENLNIAVLTARGFRPFIWESPHELPVAAQE